MTTLRASRGRTSAATICWLIAVIRKNERNGPGMETSSGRFDSGAAGEGEANPEFADGACGSGGAANKRADERVKAVRKAQDNKTERVRHDFMAQTSTSTRRPTREHGRRGLRWGISGSRSPLALLFVWA